MPTEKNKEFAFIVRDPEPKIKKTTPSAFRDMTFGSDAVMTKQLEEERFNYGMDNCYQPPYDPDWLAQIHLQNTAHARCINAKANDVAGGWSIKEREEFDGKHDPKNKQLLIEFFSNCAKDPRPGGSRGTLIDVMRAVHMDIESIGWAAIEVGRNVDGKPSRLWHVPARSIRVCRDMPPRFVQRIGVDKKFFQSFPMKCIYNEKGELAWNFMNPETGEVSKTLRRSAKGKFNITNSANELIFFSNYHPLSKIYGMPDYITAVGAVLGNIHARDYNLDYFTENMVPSYAVAVTGGNLSPTTQTTIEQYFKDIRGQGRSTLVLSVPGKDVKIHFERLEGDIKDQSFSDYTRNNRDEILLAHGVHPARIGIVETAHLGSGTGLAQLENYKSAVIEPKQRQDEAIINELLIRDGFGIMDWVFTYTDLDIRDRKTEAEIHVKYSMIGAMKTNEIRRDIGLKPLDDSELVKPYQTGAVNPPTPPKDPAEHKEVPPTPGSKTKAMKSYDLELNQLADMVREQFSSDLNRIWTSQPVSGKFLSDTEIKDKISKVRQDMTLSQIQHNERMNVMVIPALLDLLQSPLTPEDIDSIKLQMHSMFSGYLDEGWLADYETRLSEAMDASASDDDREERQRKAIDSLAWRAPLYGALAWAFFNEVTRKTAELKNVQVRWRNTSPKPCPDCIALSSLGFMSPMSLKQRPGDGLTQCRGNCRCFLELQAV